jgi:pyruvate/2-oxoglutarate dehydrogenase complex dihydrolipoamide acyltransferase (E2) component
MSRRSAARHDEAPPVRPEEHRAMSRLTRDFPPAPLAASPAPAAAAAAAAAVTPLPRRGPLASPSVRRRAALAGAVLFAVAVAHLAADDAASARAAAADPELAWLLRAMALTKAAMAAAAAWLADRLLRRPLGPGLAAGLISATALMAAAPVLMWHVAHVGTGAVLFHAGMVLMLVLGWRPTEAWLAPRSTGRPH